MTHGQVFDDYGLSLGCNKIRLISDPLFQIRLGFY